MKFDVLEQGNHDISYSITKEGLSVAKLEIYKGHNIDLTIIKEYSDQEEIILNEEDVKEIEDFMNGKALEYDVIYSGIKIIDSLYSIRRMMADISGKFNTYFDINEISKYGNLNGRGYNLIDESTTKKYKFHKLTNNIIIQMSVHDAIYKSLIEIEEKDPTVEFIEMMETGFYKTKIEFVLSGRKQVIEITEIDIKNKELKFEHDKFYEKTIEIMNIESHEQVKEYFKNYIEDEYKKARLKNTLNPNFYYSKAYIRKFSSMNLDVKEINKIVEFLASKIGPFELEKSFAKMLKKKINSYSKLATDDTGRNYVAHLAIGDEHFIQIRETRQEVVTEHVGKDKEKAKNRLKELYFEMLIKNSNEKISKIHTSIDRDIELKTLKNII